MVLAAPPSAAPAQDLPPTVRVENPMNDPELQRVADFLEPRLRVLAEGPGESALRLELSREDDGRGVFRLYEHSTLLTERKQRANEGGFDALELWLAMKNAWARARDAENQPTVRRAVVDAPNASPVHARTVTIAANTVLQGDGLSAFGAAVGFGRGEHTLGVAGELSYARAPVDDALTVHHLFVQSHLSYRVTDGFALEGSGRLSALFAVAGLQNSATFDVGLGASALVYVSEGPELWLRATVLGHPLTQRYLFDEGDRESSPVTVSVAAGVGL